LEGWKRRPGQLASALKVKRHGVAQLLAVGMVLLTGATMMRMHLQDVGELSAQRGQLPCNHGEFTV
jgi:hypothetical protein